MAFVMVHPLLLFDLSPSTPFHFILAMDNDYDFVSFYM